MKDDFAERTFFGQIELDAPMARQGEFGVYQRVGKRFFDLTFAALALALLSPLIAVLWILVRLDGGAGFFAHRRVGMNGREFMCWKLRTMIPDAEARLSEHLIANPEAAKEWAETMKLKNDSRVTRVGRILRKTRMDELPQFWNVLIGEMSVVGPRPFTPDQLALYLQSGGKAYFKLKPGLTGPWQVAGSGATEQTTFAARAVFDNEYGQKITFAKDIGLIIKTLRTLLRMNGH